MNTLTPCAHRGVAASLIIVANDHEFQSRGFPAELKPPGGSLPAQLRHQYFHKTKDLPNSFAAIMGAQPASGRASILRNDSSARKATAILPLKTPLFSESAFRNGFDRLLNSSLWQQRGLRFEWTCVHQPYPSRRVMYRRRPSTSETLLVRDGFTSCSGEVVQMLHEIGVKSLHNLIFFVPSYCHDAVVAGVRVGLIWNNTAARIATVTGLGEVSSSEKTEVRVVMHQYLPE